MASSARQREVQRLLEMRKARTARHPLFAWLQRQAEISPMEKLQRFIPMWVMDIMGYRDLNHYALRYARPADRREQQINQWVDALCTHSALFMNDWDALQMDDIVDWTASDTLSFCFLDRNMDVHRRNIAKFIKLAFAHPNPILRYWMLEALESSGEAFFHNTKQLATQAEHEAGIRLDYLGDRHDIGHPDNTESATEPFPFKGQPLDGEQRDAACDMVTTVFDAVDEQFSISLEVAETNRFAVPSDVPLDGRPTERERALGLSDELIDSL
jgi:hypothetical protein